MALVLTGTSASAHRRDELLQAARIGVDEHRVQLQLSLTPGIAVAETIIGEIDRNHDGAISEDEQRCYLNEAMGAMQLAIDGRPVPIDLVDSVFPTLEAMRDGDSPIEVNAVTALPSLSSGAHRVSFTNAYRRDISVYLMNALVPESDRIEITAQHRDPDQREMTIEFAIERTSSALLPVWLIAPAAGAWLLVRRRLLAAP